MHAHKGRVRDGRIVFDEKVELPEDAELYVVIDEPRDIDEADRAELEAMLDESLDEVRRGDTTDGARFLAELKLRG